MSNKKRPSYSLSTMGVSVLVKRSGGPFLRFGPSKRDK